MQAAIRAMTTAGAMRRSLSEDHAPAYDTTTENLVDLDYPRAVIAFEAAFDVAERRVRRIGRSDFSRKDRRSLDLALTLLGTARDEAAYPAERRAAYERVIRILETLERPITIAPEDRDAIETSLAMPAITTG